MSPKHKVKKGEDLTTIATEHGLKDWGVLFHHPANVGQDLEPSILMEGDEIWVPGPDVGRTLCSTGGTYAFRCYTPTTYVRVEVKNQGVAVAGAKYVLTIGENVFTGVTGRDGLVSQAVELGASEAKLEVTMPDGSKREWTMELGGLDPVESDSGMKQRLINLGLLIEADKDDDDKLKLALGRLQEMCGIPATGIPDPTTLEYLRTVHKC
ncbi:MAG: peptidoglycan-binding protein [Desulfovibrionaceae bacterium]